MPKLRKNVNGSYFFRGPSDQTADLSVSFATEKRTLLGSYLLQTIWMVHQTNMVYSVKKTSFISIVKAAWSDGPQNKYTLLIFPGR